MALQLRYFLDCDCGEQYVTTAFDLSQDPGETVEINVDFATGNEMTCTGCDSTIFTHPASDYAEEVS